MRYFLELAYHGGQYHGWQRQPREVSVQEKLEEALQLLLRMPVEVVGAGRTDAGVHALQIFAHMDLPIPLAENFRYRLNGVLPADIAVKGIHEVRPDAHARFSALSRTYRYFMVSHKDPFARETTCFLKQKLDLEAMNKAAGVLLEHTDFKCFSRSRTDVKTYNCVIEYAHWRQEGEKLVFEIKADRFLRNMVRAIVGTLVEIGKGKMPPDQMQQIIASRDRSQAGTSVPAHGLFLTRVEYPETIWNK